MTGYNYAQGMSNNAVAAYERGAAPISQITSADLKAAGWTGTVKLARYLAKVGVWRAAEWHHSGGTWFNKVDFYDPADLVDAWADMDAADRDAATDAANAKAVPADGQRVSGSYTVWGGSRRHPRRIGEREFTGVLAGNWIAVDGGGRKRADGNSITWREIT
jgi:hypothetical protein